MIQVIHLLTIDSGNVSVIEEKGGELSREGATMRVKKKGYRAKYYDIKKWVSIIMEIFHSSLASETL
jgi:hypothetical protein